MVVGVEWVREVGWGERRIGEMDAGDGKLRERRAERTFIIISLVLEDNK